MESFKIAFFGIIALAMTIHAIRDHKKDDLNKS